MAFVRLTVPRTSQPQDLCGIDWSNPITRGLAVVLLPGQSAVARNLVTGAEVIQQYGGDFYTLPTRYGKELSTRDSFNYNWRTQEFVAGAHTTFALVTVSTNAVGGWMLVGSDSSGWFAGELWAMPSAEGLRFGSKSRANGADTTTSTPVPIYPYIGIQNAVAITVSGTDGCSVYVGGDCAVNAPDVPGNLNLSRLLSIRGGGANNYHSYGLVLRFARVLDAREIKSLSDNPWQIFEPEETLIWAPKVTSAGSGSSIGSLNATESGSDTFAASAVVQAVPASGALAAAETGADAAVVQASAVAAGALAASEQGADIASINGKATASGQLAAVEASPDTALATAGVTASGQLNAVETGSDVFAGSATTPIAGGGRLQAQEAGTDTAAVTGSAKATGLLLAQDVGADTATASGFAVASGALVSVEPGPDTAAISAQVHAQVAAQGRLSAVESSGDAASAFISALVSGALAAIEAGSDTFAGHESAPPAAPDALYLSIADASTHLSKASGARYLSIARI